LKSLGCFFKKIKNIEKKVDIILTGVYIIENSKKEKK